MDKLWGIQNISKNFEEIEDHSTNQPLIVGLGISSLKISEFVFEVVFIIFLISFLTLASPFLEAVSGEIVLPFTFVYPRLMCIYSRNLAKMLQCVGLKRFNFGLGCLGTILSFMLDVVRNLADM